MLSDKTKNSYSIIYASDNRQLVESIPEDNTIFIGDSVSLLEVAIPDNPEDIVDIRVVLPNKKEGKRVDILNNSYFSLEGVYGYFLVVCEVVDGTIVPLSIPRLANDIVEKASFVVEGNVWTAAGATVQRAIGTLWDTVKNGAILFFGFSNIEEILESENFIVPYDCPFVSVITTNNDESRKLRLIMSQDFRAANKFITLSINLDGSAADTIDVYLSWNGSGGLVIENVPNGVYTLRCVADASYGIVISWLPLVSTGE